MATPTRQAVPSSAFRAKKSGSRSTRREIAPSIEQAAAPDLWDDQERAQQVTSRLSYVQGELNRVESLRRRLDDLSVLFELAEDGTIMLIEPYAGDRVEDNINPVGRIFSAASIVT